MAEPPSDWYDSVITCVNNCTDNSLLPTAYVTRRRNPSIPRIFSTYQVAGSNKTYVVAKNGKVIDTEQNIKKASKLAYLSAVSEISPEKSDPNRLFKFETSEKPAGILVKLSAAIELWDQTFGHIKEK